MGYDVHITKAKHWTGSKEVPVPYDAWMRLVDADPTLAVNEADFYCRKVGAGEEVIHPVEWSAHPEVALWYMDGEVTCKNPDDATIIKMVELARTLDARVLGDEGELYDLNANGTLTIDGEVLRSEGAVRTVVPSSRFHIVVGIALILAAAVLIWWMRR